MAPGRPEPPLWRWLLAGALVVFAVTTGRALVAGQPDDASDFARITLDTPAGPLPAALADEPDKRSIGYRHIDAESAPPAIFFLYPSARRVTFHMRDVRFPVRAYWIGKDDCIAGWVDMRPGDTGHDSPDAVTAVLEIPGFSDAGKALSVGDCLRWRQNVR